MEKSRIKELRAMPYEEYLQTPEWLGKRELALQKADNHCQVCNSIINLQVHHRTYENLGNENLQDLVVLCNDCHELYHHKNFIENQLYSIKSLIMGKTWEQLEKPNHLPTGFVDIDSALGGLQGGELITIGGVSGVGKSILAANILLNIANRNDGKCLYFNLEMHRNQFIQNLIAMEVRFPLNEIQLGKIEPEDRERLDLGVERLESYDIHIDDTSHLTLKQIEYKVLKLKKETGLDLAIIDYLQLIDNKNSTTSYNPHYCTTEIMKSLKGLAKDANIPIITISRIPSSSMEKRIDKRPILADFETNSIADDSDIVLLLYRPEIFFDDAPEGIAEICIAKNRRGSTSSLTLGFFPEFLRFENLGSGHKTSETDSRPE